MTPRTAPIAVTATLLLLLAALPTPSATGATTRALEITPATANPQVPFKAFDGNPPKVFDINGDGQLEIIAQNDNQWVYVFDSKNGKLLFEAKTMFPPGWAARTFNGPEVAILTQDAQVRLVVANSAAVVTSYRFDPGASTGSRFHFVKEWDRRLDDCHSNPGMDSKPVLVDLDKDGRLEILGATEESGIFALRHDGSLFWKRCLAGGNAEPGIGDLDRDGFPEVVYGSDGGHLTALQGRTGSTMWSLFLPHHFNLGAASMPVGPTIAQLDGKAGPDVVVGVRDSHDANNPSNNHALLLAVDSAGKILWGRQDAQAHGLTYTHPVVVDADGNGPHEVYWGDWNTNGHKPPFNSADAWQRLGPAHFYRYDAAGTLVWRQTLDTWWSNNDIALADVDADGKQEVLANGPNGGHDGLWYLNTATGAKKTFVSAHPYKVQRGPIVADLWSTNTMQIVLPVAPNAAGSSHGILVYDTGAPFNAAWPHLPYPTPPRAGGTFDATFRISNPGEWWQQLSVEPDTPRTITQAQVRVDGGAWSAMKKEWWGDWTSSRHTPAGSRVEFLATDSNGAQSQSAPFTWLDGTTTQRSVTPGDPPAQLTADFQVSENVNEWWVEVFVDASAPLSKVEVSKNGGAWTALSATDWGSWARSINIPAGTPVQFRATSTQGAQATSETITWLGVGSAFDASFDVSPNVNNWWVEVTVTANRPVTAVHASINGGSWTALSKTDWGTWVKSIHVPSGSEVRFRATDDAANTDTSQAFTWS